MQKFIQCRIKGLPPGLLMNRFPMEELPKPVTKMTPEEACEVACYRDPDTNELVLPAVNMQRALVSGGTYVKGKGRASLQKPFAACVFITPERIGFGREDYEIDARSVVIGGKTGGRVKKFRPWLRDWEITFDIEYEDSMLTERQVREVVECTGKYVGLLDFRPECKGPFGRFNITLWEAIKEPKTFLKQPIKLKKKGK